MVLRGTGDINPVPGGNSTASSSRPGGVAADSGVLPTPTTGLNTYNNNATNGARVVNSISSGPAGVVANLPSAIKDDYYLCAVVGASTGNSIPVTQYLSVGGSALRKVEESEASQLSKVGIYVVKGHNLVDIASRKDHAEVIALLVTSLEEQEVTSGGVGSNGDGSGAAVVASKPISALIVTPPHGSKPTLKGVNTPPPAPLSLPAANPSTMTAAAAGSGVSEQHQKVIYLGGKDVNEILDNDELLQLQLEQEAESLLENVRLEILSTTDIREDGLVHFWTAHPRFKLIDRGGTTSAATSSSGGSGGEAVMERSKRGRTASAGEGAEVGTEGNSCSDRAMVVGRSFALPTSLEELDWKKRNEAMSQFLEQPVMMEDIHKAIDFFPLVPGCSEFVPLYTAADLNCLLHGCFTSMCAVRDDMLASEDPNASTADTRTVLRDAVYNSLSNCLPLQQVVTGTAIGGGVTGENTRLNEMLKDASHKASLDGGHCFALANVLRRPIVVFAHKELEGAYREDLRAPFRVSGIYLPLLWDPPIEDGREETGSTTTTVTDPIVLCYSQGHFSSIVGFTPSLPSEHQRGGKLPFLNVPLCDETLGPLPIHFSQASPQYADFESALPLPPSVLESLALKQSEQLVDHGEEEGDAAPDRKKELDGGGSKRFGHNEVELALLSAYLRGVSTASLGDGESEQEFQITLCQQHHLLLHHDVTGDDSRKGVVPPPVLSDLFEPESASEEALAETHWWKYFSMLTSRINEKVSDVKDAAANSNQTSHEALTN